MLKIARFLTIGVFFAISSLFAAWTPMTIVPSSADGSAAAYLGDFIALDGMSRPEANTAVYVWKDAEALHFRFECQEPYMGKVKSLIDVRDGAVWSDDCVEVFLLPAGAEEYLHFIANLRGVQYDERGRDVSWDGEWSVQTHGEIYDWSAEFAIPFRTLGVVPQEGDQWRMNVGRSRYSVKEISSWSSTVKETFHDIECFGTIRFSDTEPFAVGAPAQREANAPAPQLNWHGEEPVLRTVETRQGHPGYRVLCEEYVSNDRVVMQCYHVTRNYRGEEILAPALSRIADLQSDDAKALRGEAAVLLSTAGVPAALFPPLERQAEQLAARITYYADRQAFQAQGHQVRELLYGVETSLVKLLPIEPYRGEIGGAVKLDAARNEMDAAQVTLFAGDAPLLLAHAKLAGDLVQEDGTSLAASNFRIRRVGYVQMVPTDYKVTYTGPWPDPLMEATPFDVAANGRETLWVDVRVPMDAKPGRYVGQLILEAKNALPTIVPVEVLVRSFAIPKDSSIVSAFGLHGFAVPQDVVAYRENMHEHRVSPYRSCQGAKLLRKPSLDVKAGDEVVLTVSTDRPGRLRVVVVDVDNIQQTLVEQKIPAGENQRVSGVFAEGAKFDGLWALEAKLTGAGVATLTAVLRQDGRERTLIDAEESFANFGEEWMTAWPEWEFQACDLHDRPAEVDWSGFDADFEAALARGITSHELPSGSPRPLWMRLYRQHLIEKGWFQHFYTYLADEPEPKDYPYINEALASAKRIGDHGIHNMMTARSFPEALKFVDIWCPEIYSYDEAGAKAEQERGRMVWWYTAYGTRHPYPNVWIDYPAIDCRVWPWMTWKHDLDGMLYWAVTWWGWNNPWFSGGTFPKANGDGSLMYPGEDGRPVDSLRWECFRDGMEDYEVFCLLEAARRELGDRQPELAARIDALLAIDPSVLEDFEHYNLDPKPMLEARRAMSDALEEAIAALGHQPAIVGRPRWRKGLVGEEAAATLAEFDEAEHVRRRTVFEENRAKLEALETGRPSDLPEEGLRAYYDFEGAFALAADRSGNRLDAMPAEGQRVAGVGHPGAAFRTKARWGRVMLPGGSEILGPQPETGTIACWVCPAFDNDFVAERENVVLAYLMETDQNATPSGWDEIGIYLNDGKLKARVGGKGPNVAVGEVPSPLKMGEWTHLALTWKPGERILYVNGVPAITNDKPFAAPKLDGFPGTLGTHPSNISLYAPGTYDEFRIYDRALSAEEIQRLAQ